MALFKPLCKFCVSVTRFVAPACAVCIDSPLTRARVKDIVPLLREAFRQAQSGVPGPVFVEFPIDSLYPYSTIVKELVPETKGSAGPQSIGQRITAWYLQNYLNRLFGGMSRRCTLWLLQHAPGAFDPQDTSPLPVDIPMPRSSDVCSAC